MRIDHSRGRKHKCNIANPHPEWHASAGGGGGAASGPGAVKGKKRKHAAADDGAAGTGGLESSSPAAGQAERQEGTAKGRAAGPGGGSKGGVAKPGGVLSDALAALGKPWLRTVHLSYLCFGFKSAEMLSCQQSAVQVTNECDAIMAGCPPCLCAW